MGFVGSMLSGSHGAGFQAVQPSAKQLKTSYNQTQDSIAQQKAFVQALQAQNGLANQSNTFNQLQGVANGTGPNPAQAMLAQQTGANVANQAALMAGQRGASANTGLIARQAAQQGGNLQQQAVGQGATLQAQQSLNALGQMGGIAGQQVGETQAGLQNYGQQTLGQQQNLYGLQGNANTVNGGIAQGNQSAQANLTGNLLGAAGTAAGFMFGGPAGAVIGKEIASGSTGSSRTNGGSAGVKIEAEGGLIADGPTTGPRSKVGQHLMMAKGGKVPALVSPGEVYLKPHDVKAVAEGKKAPMDGEKIPGKAKVKGAKNDYANDTVRKDLDEGGVILPRSVTQSKDSDRKAIEFVQAILAKHAKSLPKK